MIEDVLDHESVVAVDTLEAVFAADHQARLLAGQWLSRHGR